MHARLSRYAGLPIERLKDMIREFDQPLRSSSSSRGRHWW
jgi:hypothetical protein